MKRKLFALWRDKNRRNELIRYLAAGVLTTLVNWGVYVGLTAVLGLAQMEIHSASYHMAASVCNWAAWILSVLVAFFVNKKWVFESVRDTKKGALREFLMFVSARALSYLLFDLALFNLCLALVPDFFFVITRDQWIKLVMNGLVIVFNYFASRLVVFRKN